MAGDETRQKGSFRGDSGVRSHRAKYAMQDSLKLVCGKEPLKNFAQGNGQI